MIQEKSVEIQRDINQGVFVKDSKFVNLFFSNNVVSFSM
jgi:hypothetical protein